MSLDKKTYKLDEVYEFKSGLSKSRDQFGFGDGFVSFKDVFNNYFIPDKLTQLANTTEKEQLKCSVKRGDVFLTRTSETFDELGMSAVALRDYPKATFNGFTKRLRPTGAVEIDPVYAGYFFRSSKFRNRLNAMATMSTRASLNNEILSKLEIRLPPLSEQIEIGKKLKVFDDKIALNRRTNETLEAIAQGLFKSWFVDFDPVIDNALDVGHALPEALAKKVAQRRAVRASGKYAALGAEVRALFPDKVVWSEELGKWVPEGWGVTTLGEAFEITMGQSPPGRELVEEPVGMPFFQGRRDFGERFPTNRIYCATPKRIAEAGSTLISVRAPVGDYNIALEQCGIGRGVAAIRARNGKSAYTYHSIIALQGELERYNSEGTVFGSISGADLKSIEILLPTVITRTNFCDRVTVLSDLLQANRAQQHKLGTASKTLLDAL